MKNSPIIEEAFRFIFVGILCTLLHYGLYYLMQLIINVNIAYTLGYFISFAINFWLTSRFTFGTSPSWKKLFGMGGAHGVNYILHIILLNLFIHIGIPQEWAPIPVFTIAIPINFILVRFVFKNKKL